MSNQPDPHEPGSLPGPHREPAPGPVPAPDSVPGAAGKRELARDTALSIVGISLSGAAQFLVSLLVARLAGPAALGVVRGSVSLANTAALLWPTSAGQSASLFVARSIGAGQPRRAAASERYLVAMTAAVVLLLAPAAAAAGYFWLDLTGADAVWIGALTATFSAYHLARGIMFGRGAIPRATQWEAAASLVMVGLIWWVLAGGYSGWYLAPMVVGYGIYAIGAWRTPRPSAGLGGGDSASKMETTQGDTGALDSVARRELRTFVLWGVAGTLASTGLLQLSMVLAAATESGEQAGLYAAAISLATPVSMLARALSMALFPEMARQRGRGESNIASTNAATRGLIALMVPAFGVVALLAHPLLAFLYGADYNGAAPLLRILLLAVLLTTIPVAGVNSISVLGSRGVRLTALFSWVGFTVGMIGMVVFDGVMGVALGYLAGATVTALLPYLYVWRRDAQAWGIPSLLLVLAIASLAGAVWFLDRSDWLVAAGVTAVFLLVWLPAAWYLLRGRRPRTR